MSKRRGSSDRWVREHEADPYVRRARREGRVARSAYKLIEIDTRERLLRPGMTVVDLGAAPGGWSAYAAEKVGPSGRVVALDLLPMDAPASVEFIQGDFLDDRVLGALRERLSGPVDLVLSDMAPNFSGNRAVDQPRAMELAEAALILADELLEQRGSLLLKVFQGEGFDSFVRALRSRFGRVATRKPDASRARSREVYLLGTSFTGSG